jgi:hypothetical protein
LTFKRVVFLFKTTGILTYCVKKGGLYYLEDETTRERESQMEQER